jgi:hypothetical protein
VSDPTNAELVRRLDELVRRIDDLVRTQEARYATKETVDRVEQVHSQRIKELEKDNEAAAAFKRQVTAGFIVGFLLLLVPLIGFVQNLAGGAP